MFSQCISVEHWIELHIFVNYFPITLALIMWKLGNSRKTSLGFNNYAKAFDCVDHNKLWKALEETGTPDHLTCLLRNLYADQEATVRTLYGTSDWFKTEKGIWQGCLLSPCLFNLYAEHIMRNAGLDELQAGSKTGRRNNSLTYAYDTTLMAENEDEWNSLLMRVEEESESLRLKHKA